MWDLNEQRAEHDLIQRCISGASAASPLNQITEKRKIISFFRVARRLNTTYVLVQGTENNLHQTSPRFVYFLIIFYTLEPNPPVIFKRYFKETGNELPKGSRPSVHYA